MRLLNFLILLIISPSAISSISVPTYYQQAAAIKKVPALLLYAIASQESKPPADVYPGVSRPWPWTLNCNGKGYFLAERLTAIRVARAHIEQGLNCDIGLMQISWRWHKSRFDSIEQAFDPISNLKAGADYLYELHAKHGSWEYAVGAYHSPTNRLRAVRYREKVRQHLLKLLRSTF